MRDERMDRERLEALREFAGRLGLTPGSWDLLDEALTHASILTEAPEAGARDYESLEFLGDAVLELAVSHYLFESMPGRRPGDYTNLRATVVNRDCVGRVARRAGLAPYIRLGKGEESGGGRKRTALLADCLEAVIGAIYLEAGWLQARDFVLRIFAPELEPLRGMPPTWDYKSLLQTWCQGRHLALPRFELVRSDGPDHCKEFEVEVYVQDAPLGRGTGRTKKEAEQRAACEALKVKNVLE